MNPTNPGQFMSPAGSPGQGSALQRLMQLRQQNAGGANQNPGSSGYVPPASNPTTNAINPSQLAQAGQQQPQPTQPPAAPAGNGSINPNVAMNPGDPNLNIALSALANYAKAHSDALLADHGVHMQKAHAKVVESQANPPSAPVGS